MALCPVLRKSDVSSRYNQILVLFRGQGVTEREQCPLLRELGVMGKYNQIVVGSLGGQGARGEEGAT